jgi:hypothetical protein
MVIGSSKKEKEGAKSVTRTTHPPTSLGCVPFIALCGLIVFCELLIASYFVFDGSLFGAFAAPFLYPYRSAIVIGGHILIMAVGYPVFRVWVLQRLEKGAKRKKKKRA